MDQEPLDSPDQIDQSVDINGTMQWPSGRQDAIISLRADTLRRGKSRRAGLLVYWYHQYRRMWHHLRQGVCTLHFQNPS